MKTDKMHFRSNVTLSLHVGLHPKQIPELGILAQRFLQLHKSVVERSNPKTSLGNSVQQGRRWKRLAEV